MRLTHEEMRQYETKKKDYMLTTTDLATMLGTTPEDLFKCSVGHDVNENVCDAVKEWISE